MQKSRESDVYWEVEPKEVMLGLFIFIAKSNACTGEERVVFEGIQKIQTVEKRRETGVLGDRTDSRFTHIKQDPNT